MKKIYLLLAVLMPLLSFAQRQATGNLTVFSEDGDKFYLVLNGEQQNDVPQSNIRIEELPQPYYSAKIIFADSTLSPISKNNLLITDADGVMMDVTYRIRKDKSKKVKLNAYSAIPVERDFIPPAGMYVRHYGQPVGGLHAAGAAEVYHHKQAERPQHPVDGWNVHLPLNIRGVAQLLARPKAERHGLADQRKRAANQRLTGNYGR